MSKNYNINFVNGSASEQRMNDAKFTKYKIEAKYLWRSSAVLEQFKKKAKKIVLYSLPASFVVMIIVGIENHYSEFFLFALFYMWYLVICTIVVLFIVYLVKRKRFIDLYVSSKIVEEQESNNSTIVVNDLNK